MLDFGVWLTFAGVALAMVLTPGPNMAYLISRSLCQGPRAGLISLGGVLAGFTVYIGLAAFGITALFVAVPYAYDAVRLAGAAYLGWLAWQTLRPGGSSPFAPRTLAADPPRKLFAMGLVTNLLNPKIAMLYLSLLPQFLDPQRGAVLAQSLLLGATQLVISAAVNSVIVLTAGTIAGALAARPLWSRLQRWILGTVLAALAVRMAVDTHKQ